MARVVVQQYERAVLHASGQPARVLEPGRHWYRKRRSSLVRVDLRPAQLKVAGQEILSADGVGVRTSAVVRYAVVEPLAWVLSGQDADGGREALYLAVQLGLRDLVSARSAVDLLRARASASETLLPAVAATAQRVGVAVDAVDLRDLTFPGDLRRSFAETAIARQEAAAALERARGETATLRSLANAARVLDGSSSLRELRSLLAVERTGGTVVVRQGRSNGHGNGAGNGSAVQPG